MTPEEWSRIQQGIFAGESGGDYGALFNYQNRENGRFSDVNLTGMTVDQALDFASPSGPYGQYVKGQVGRVATPMGAYQVVGTTLRAAKNALGLTGNEVMTPEMQDQIGQWIYRTQGTGAWEGYKPLTDAQAVGAETMAALGKTPMQGRAGTQGEAPMMQEEQQPRGLLGTLGIQKMEEGAPGEAGQRFYERDTFKDTAAVMAEAFAGLGSNPTLQKAAAGIASQRTEAKARNKTVEYLRANGRGDLADMIEQGMISGKDAASALLAKPEDGRTALVKNYEYFIAQGMTPEQAMAAVKTGSTTNVNMPKPVGTIPPGYAVQYDDAGNPVSMSAIPGGPAATEQAAAAAEAGSEGDRLVSAADDSIRLINEIYNDPNLESITGMIQGRIPPMSQAGTDLNVKIEQAKGQVFMSAFESLKGAGAITENESAAATAAIARLQREQSAEAYRKSLKELVDLLDRGKRRAQAGVRASDNDEYGLVVGEGF